MVLTQYVWLGWYLNCNFIRIYRVAAGIPTHCEGDGNLKYTKNTYWTNLPPGQNGRNFADNILRCIFMNEKFRVLINILLKFVLKGSIENSPALV